LISWNRSTEPRRQRAAPEVIVRRHHPGRTMNDAEIAAFQ
jgi:hypothetical protein